MIPAVRSGARNAGRGDVAMSRVRLAVRLRGILSISIATYKIGLRRERTSSIDLAVGRIVSLIAWATLLCDCQYEFAYRIIWEVGMARCMKSSGVLSILWM